MASQVRWPWGDGYQLLTLAGRSYCSRAMVEAGFSEVDRVELGKQLVELQEPTAAPWREHRGQPIYPVRPDLTVDMQLLEWTALGQGRHVSYKGIGRRI